MTDKNLTEIVAILDRSGSMQKLVNETISGFNNFLSEQQKLPGKAVLTLVQFDDQYQINYDGVDINDVKPLNTATYVPRGWTALLDAVGKTVNTVGERLAKTPEENRPGKVVFLIVTDGEENSSKEFFADRVSEMVKHQTEKYSWSFVFLGGGSADFQIKQAMSMGISAHNAYNYNANVIGTKAVYNNLSRGLSRMRLADDAAPAAAFLTDDEQKDLKG